MWFSFSFFLTQICFEDSSYDLFTTLVLKTLHMTYLLVQFWRVFIWSIY